MNHGSFLVLLAEEWEWIARLMYVVEHVSYAVLVAAIVAAAWLVLWTIRGQK